MTAGGEAVVLNDRVPEKAGGDDVTRFARISIAVHRADELGHLRVGVLACEDILVTFERLDEGAMFEAVGKVKPAFVACVGIKIGQHFIHAAELGVQHLLILGFGKPGKNPLGPFGELYLDFESGTVARMAICVAQTGKRFMQDIPRCPKPVEVEAARADVSLSHGFPAFPAPLQCTEIAVAVFVLDFLEFLYDIVRSLFETRISRGGPHQAYSREVMSGDVTGEISSAAVPAAVWFALRL